VPACVWINHTPMLASIARIGVARIGASQDLRLCSNTDRDELSAMSYGAEEARTTTASLAL